MGHAATVQHLHELWATGRLDLVEEYFDPAIEWNEPPQTIGRNTVVGVEAALAALANWTEQFDAIRAETTELLERGDRVLHGMQQYARFQGSDAEIAGELYMVWWFRGDRAARMEMYTTRAEAEQAFTRQEGS